MKMAKEYNALFGETSAKKNIGVSDAFESIASNYVENRSNNFHSDQRKDTISLKDKKKNKEGGK